MNQPLPSSAVEPLELAGARPDEAPRNSRGAQAERGRDRLGALSVGLAAQSAQDAEQAPPIGPPRPLQALIRHEGGLPVAGGVRDLAVGDGELLIREVDRPAWPPPRSRW